MVASNKTHAEQQQRVRAFRKGVYHWVVVLNAAAVGCSLLHSAHLTRLLVRTPSGRLTWHQHPLHKFFKKKKKKGNILIFPAQRNKCGTCSAFHFLLTFT